MDITVLNMEDYLMKRNFIFLIFVLSSAFILPSTLSASNVEADVDMEKKDKRKTSSSPKTPPRTKKARVAAAKTKANIKKSLEFELIPMTPIKSSDHSLRRYWERRLSDPENKQDRAKFHLDLNSGMLFEKVKTQ
jgi:hypothetical protein